MSTDLAWVRWGEQDPYFAVITDPAFRAADLDAAAKARFFASGAEHVSYVLDTCRRRVDPAFSPRRALDFGCGVGRVALPLAEQIDAVVGVDVSPAMLAEARRNAADRGLTNLELLPSDDTLSALQGRFDLVHCFIVFQHIDVVRGRCFFARLLEHLADGGIGALHVTTAKAYHPDTYGQPPSATEEGGLRRLFSLGAAKPPPAPDDPEMLMNPYNLSELSFLLQRAGVQRMHTEFTDHGGELGAFLFFQKPAQPVPPA